MRKELLLEASESNLEKAQAFFTEILEEIGADSRTLFQTELSVEEIFINIAHYAYPDGKGFVLLSGEIMKDPKGLKMEFVDQGIPFDPLAKDDPDTSLGAEERSIGGLGIFMVKKNMDAMEYRYEDGKNHLTMVKNV